jgi:metallo-beta-lactamase family protein
MKIVFHGAARTVTGSKHLLQLPENVNILLDCGMFQGLGRKTTSLNADFGFDPKTITAVLLSHAHIDHSGLLPKLVKEGFSGKIYCTPATLELTEILLLDSASIQAHDQSDAHDALYTVEDVRTTMELFETVSYEEWTNIHDNVRVQYTPTGHLIGSAAIHIEVFNENDRTTISYSADIGRSNHPLLRPAAVFPCSEYLIVESTYGDKHHPLPGSAIDNLRKHIAQTCIQQKGQLVIAAFSVGRTQELLFMLNQLELENRLPAISYFVDSPLGSKATQVMKKYTGEFNDSLQKILQIDDDPFEFQGLKWVEHPEDSKRLAEYTEPCVIIASSGTGDAGRIRHHLQQKAGNPNNTLLFSGYCGPDSTGGELLAGKKIIEIGKSTVEVRAAVAQLAGMSAHGDAEDICNFLKCQDPAAVRAVFLVHGEPQAQQALSKKLELRGFYPVHTPELQQEFALKLDKTAKVA